MLLEGAQGRPGSMGRSVPPVTLGQNATRSRHRCAVHSRVIRASSLQCQERPLVHQRRRHHCSTQGSQTQSARQKQSGNDAM